jgi:predicted ATPase/DNA-binding SARP family transcriptional activator
MQTAGYVRPDETVNVLSARPGPDDRGRAGEGVTFEVLGLVDARVEGRPVAVGHARQRSVLAVLLVEANRPVAAAQLVERVWGERPPFRARETLYNYLSRLRRALAPLPGVDLGRRAGGYVLTVDPMAVDVHRFRQLVGQARAAADEDRALRLFEQALGLWRGEPCAGLDTEWGVALRDKLRRDRFAVELDSTDLRMVRGEHRWLLSELAARAQAHPLDERVAGQVMLALYRCGRQAEALDHFQQLRVRLAESLGIDPGPALQRRYEQILTTDAALDPPAPPRPAPAAGSSARLPVPLTSLVGRAADLAAARRMLATRRMVTLTGAAGCGKSRLAIAVATDQSTPAAFVDLTQVAAPGLVPGVVADAVGAREQVGRGPVDWLLDHFGNQPWLLVLDNCEHVVEACEHLASVLLSGCSGLRILVTSRESLRVPGAVVQPVRPLAAPDPDVAHTYQELLDYPAVRLFVDRTNDAGTEVGTDPSTVDALAVICARLDGLPLAIELAAARTVALPVPRIAAHLRDRFPTLGSGGHTARPQHRSLRTAVEWSYRLLEPDERALLRRLSVFAGDFDLAAVEAQWHRGDAVHVLGRLVDKSVLSSDPGRARYRLLHTIRRYAADQLTGAELTEARRRHAEFHRTGPAARPSDVDGARWMAG